MNQYDLYRFNNDIQESDYRYLYNLCQKVLDHNLFATNERNMRPRQPTGSSNKWYGSPAKGKEKGRGKGKEKGKHKDKGNKGDAKATSLRPKNGECFD